MLSTGFIGDSRTVLGKYNLLGGLNKAFWEGIRKKYIITGLYHQF